MEMKADKTGGTSGLELSLKLGLLLVLLTLLFAGAPTSSEAATDGYQCGLMSPNSWCQNYAARNFWYNESHETYSGNVFVCLKEIRQSNGSTYSSACGYTPVSHTFPLCNCGGIFPMMQNLASGSRQLYGIAYY